jgi:branched-chain amino acid transport system substrate-binding protein
MHRITERRDGRANFFTAARVPRLQGEEAMLGGKWVLLGAAIGVALLATSGVPVRAEDTIKIGALTNLEGPFAVPGKDGHRGVDLAVKLHNGTAGGKKIEIIKYSSDATPDKAVAATRKAVEEDHVDIMIGPLSGDEGIAVKNYSKTHPEMVFVNGSSGAQATTLQDPSPNFYRFNTEGAQWMVGLGDVALAKGYKKMWLVAEDYGYPYSQVQGFMASYCAHGGHVVKKAWVPLGTKDYSSVISGIPADVDALLVVLGGSDAVNFLNQAEQAGIDKPFVGGSITVDQTVLNYKGKKRESLLGTDSAGPMADGIDTPEWKKFVADYKANFPDGFPSPSLFAYLYFINTQAVLLALDEVHGDLSNNQAKLKAALAKLEFDGPAGHIKLDENRNAIGTTFITEVAKAPDGSFYNKVIKVVPDVSETLGLSKADFEKMGLGNRDVPSCP